MPNRNVVIFTKDQENAISAFMDFMIDKKEKFFVIQGAAGTGKSFLMKHLAESFESKEKVYRMMANTPPVDISTIKFAASTNKAVAVLAKFLNGENKEDAAIHISRSVSTLHRTLGLKIVNNYKTGKAETKTTNDAMVYTNTLLFVDEASFIDEELFAYLENATTNSCKVVLVGDYYQLAPVGEQKTVMETLGCKKVVMNEVVRNSGAILKTSHNFRETVETGVFKKIPFDADSVIYVNGKQFQEMVNANFRVPGWSPDKAKILAWTNARVQEYNKYVRTLNHLPELMTIGETVMTNNAITTKSHMYQIDSTVTITDIKDDPVIIEDVPGRMLQLDDYYWAFMPNDFLDMKKTLNKLAREKEWATYFAIKENWLDLRSTYASSVHKAQGSTYEKVFIDLDDIGRNWLSEDVARLLYVAISRGAKQVICNGSLPAHYAGR